MKKTSVQMTIAFLYHAVFILLSFIVMRHDCGIVLGWSFISAVAYLIYWIVIYRKSYIPWSVYGCFIVGTAVEAALNLKGIIPPDSGVFGGLGQAIYVYLIVLEAIVIAVVNVILYVINKYRGSIQD